MTFVPDQDGTVVLDPGREHLAPRTWQVQRVDVGPEGERTTPVEDVEIHQSGYPLEPAHTKHLALILPTRSAKGRLQLHVRRSPAHAEIEHVKVTGELITVQGHVLAHDDADARARLALRLRSSPRTVREFSAPVSAGGEFTWGVARAVLVHGRHGESERWELVLVLSDGTECTVGRHWRGSPATRRSSSTRRWTWFPKERAGLAYSPTTRSTTGWGWPPHPHHPRWAWIRYGYVPAAATGTGSPSTCVWTVRCRRVRSMRWEWCAAVVPGNVFRCTGFPGVRFPRVPVARRRRVCRVSLLRWRSVRPSTVPRVGTVNSSNC